MTPNWKLIGVLATIGGGILTLVTNKVEEGIYHAGPPLDLGQRPPDFQKTGAGEDESPGYPLRA